MTWHIKVFIVLVTPTVQVGYENLADKFGRHVFPGKLNVSYNVYVHNEIHVHVHNVIHVQCTCITCTMYMYTM